MLQSWILSLLWKVETKSLRGRRSAAKTPPRKENRRLTVVSEGARQATLAFYGSLAELVPVTAKTFHRHKGFFLRPGQGLSTPISVVTRTAEDLMYSGNFLRDRCPDLARALQGAQMHWSERGLPAVWSVATEVKDAVKMRAFRAASEGWGVQLTWPFPPRSRQRGWCAEARSVALILLLDRYRLVP